MSRETTEGDGVAATRWRTLLVDDATQLRGLVRIVLERTGRFEVVAEASNGIEGIALAGALRPELVLLDLLMPGMDGMAALPHIRAALPASSKIVIYSGLDEMPESDLAAAGAAGYIVKGTNTDEMISRLLEILEG